MQIWHAATGRIIGDGGPRAISIRNEVEYQRPRIQVRVIRSLNLHLGTGLTLTRDRQVMAQRRNVAEKKGRPVVIVAERDSLSSASKSFTNTLVKRRQVVDERGVADKRERLEKTKLLELIFKAFRKQDYWTLKDLNNHCNQPVVSSALYSIGLAIGLNLRRD